MGSGLRRLRAREEGMSLVFVGMGMFSFVVASALAVDVGMFMTARNQAQNSADAGALAGASVLAFEDFNDRSPSGATVTSAVTVARANPVMSQAVSVQPEDVTFPTDPVTGLNTRIRVQVYRTSARGNPLNTIIGALMGVTHANLGAAATAEAIPSNADTCVAPFTIPDEWVERQTPAWDTSDTFTAFPTSPTLRPDVYTPADQVGYSGYDPFRDRGLQITLSANTGPIAPGGYIALQLPNSNGPDDYRVNIGSCNTARIPWGNPLTPEVQDRSVPTSQGIQDLIDQDPTAYWDTASNRVVSSMHPSPRVKVIPVYDPYYYESTKKAGNAVLKAANFIGLFIESLAGSSFVGRITPVSGLTDSSVPSPAGGFARTIRLVE